MHAHHQRAHLCRQDSGQRCKSIAGGPHMAHATPATQRVYPCKRARRAQQQPQQAGPNAGREPTDEDGASRRRAGNVQEACQRSERCARAGPAHALEVPRVGGGQQNPMTDSKPSLEAEVPSALCHRNQPRSAEPPPHPLQWPMITLRAATSRGRGGAPSGAQQGPPLPPFARARARADPIDSPPGRARPRCHTHAAASHARQASSTSLARTARQEGAKGCKPPRLAPTFGMAAGRQARQQLRLRPWGPESMGGLERLVQPQIDRDRDPAHRRSRSPIR